MKNHLNSLENAAGDPEREYEYVGENDGLQIYQDNLVNPFLPEKIEIGMRGRWRFKKLVMTTVSKNPVLYK